MIAYEKEMDIWDNGLYAGGGSEYGYLSESY